MLTVVVTAGLQTYQPTCDQPKHPKQDIPSTLFLKVQLVLHLIKLLLKHQHSTKLVLRIADKLYTALTLILYFDTGKAVQNKGSVVGDMKNHIHVPLTLVLRLGFNSSNKVIKVFYHT